MGPKQGVVTLATLALLVAACVGLAQGKKHPRRPFEVAAWAQAGVDRDSARVEMVDDLLGSHRLSGATQAQVRQLLGPPEPKNYFKGLGFDETYRLGAGRGWFPGTAYLGVRYDAVGRFAEAKVLKD